MIQVNPFISKVIGVVVVLIVIVSVAVPVISTLTQPETISNDAELRYSLYAAEDVPNFTLVVDSETQTITMNDEPVDWPTQESGFRAFILAYGAKYNVWSSECSITNDCTIAGPYGDGTITWTQDTAELYVDYGNSRSTIKDVKSLIMPDADGSLGAFNSQFWGQGGQHTYVIGQRSGYETITFYCVNDETMTGTSGVNKDPLTCPSIDSIGDAYKYDVSQMEFGGLVTTYESAIAIGDLEVVSEESNPVMDMINLVPLLLVVGLIIAAVAAFITLKSRGGGA